MTVTTIQNEETGSIPTLDMQPILRNVNDTPPRAQFQSSGLSSSRPQYSWISQFVIPWDKMPASLLQATLRQQRAKPEDRRAWKRTVVSAIQQHCPNPKKAACDKIAKMIVSKYPLTFADTNEEGEQLGVGYFSLAKQLKTRVEHVN